MWAAMTAGTHKMAQKALMHDFNSNHFPAVHGFIPTSLCRKNALKKFACKYLAAIWRSYSSELPMQNVFLQIVHAGLIILLVAAMPPARGGN